MKRLRSREFWAGCIALSFASSTLLFCLMAGLGISGHEKEANEIAPFVGYGVLCSVSAFSVFCFTTIIMGLIDFD